MIVSVAREFHWPPSIIGGFFIDDDDLQGLGFWYNDCIKISESIKPKAKE